MCQSYEVQWKVHGAKAASNLCKASALKEPSGFGKLQQSYCTSVESVGRTENKIECVCVCV